MAVNSVSQEALPHAVGMTYLAFLSATPPEVVLGAFTGSVVFLLGVSNKPKWQWLLYFVLAFMAGLLGAEPVASIVAGLLGLISVKVTVPLGMGALLSASCTINLVSWLRDDLPRIARARLAKGEKA